MSKNFASKKAEEHAYEHGLTLDDFSHDKISKRDVEDKVRSDVYAHRGLQLPPRPLPPLPTKFPKKYRC